MKEPVMPSRERRTIPLELTIQRADGKAKIVGYAARFNTLSEDMGGWREQIAPGAFAGVLGDDVRALFNHDPNYILGRNAAGTLKLKEDAKGLWIECEPPETEQARGIVTSIERGDVSGQSFSFSLPPMPEGRIWEEDADGTYVRTITKIARLWDTGPVVYPAYPDTDIAVRSLGLEEAKAIMRRELPDFANMRRRLELAGL